MSNYSNSTAQIIPTGMPFAPSFLGDNFLKFVVTLALIAVYIYMVMTKKTHQFRHFTAFHVIMHTNIFFLFLWQILPVFWKFLEGFAICFWIVFLAIFYMGMINQILLNFVLCQVVTLFFAENDIHSQRGRCNVGKEKLIVGGAIGLLALEIILAVVWKFHRTIAGHILEIDISIILSHILIISLLISWFTWWLKSGRKARLSQQQLCYLVNSVLFISVSTVLLIFSAVLNVSSQEKDEIVHLTLPLGTLLILPFLWIISTLIADQPALPKFFYPVPDAIVEFNMT